MTTEEMLVSLVENVKNINSTLNNMNKQFDDVNSKINNMNSQIEDINNQIDGETYSDQISEVINKIRFKAINIFFISILFSFRFSVARR